MSVLFTHLRSASRSLGRIKSVRYQHSGTVADFPKIIESGIPKFHVYISGIRDPYLNLSIEHYVYEKSALDSTILLLYINDPCVVIGRNQNPWLEANLKALSKKNIPLIRRRSGGGTVYHDHGNVNFSVIYPPADFTRDKYAELVTRALRPYQPRARVNERHDIVIDLGLQLKKDSQPPEDDMHRSAYENSRTHKCSGSAYKLSRNRALHHGTCLINTRDLGLISSCLRSPLEPYIKARGVDSVRSSVTNAFNSKAKDPIGTFITSVIKTFSDKHNLEIPAISFTQESRSTSQVTHLGDVIVGIFGEDMKTIRRIDKGMAELKSPAWLWGQTPRFDFSTFPTEDDARERPALPKDVPPMAKLNFSSRSGQILSANMSLSPSVGIDGDFLIDKHIHAFESWHDVLRPKPVSGSRPLTSANDLTELAIWLDMLFGKV